MRMSRIAGRGALTTLCLWVVACGEPADVADATPNEAPAVTVTEPAAGAIFESGATVSLVAEVSDPDDLATSLTVDWSSNLAGTLQEGVGAGADGRAELTLDSLVAGTHTVTVTVVDPAGAAATADVTFTVRSPVDAPTVAVTPSDALTIDTLVASITAAPKAWATDEVEYAWAWVRDGAAAGPVGPEVAPAYTHRGETWQVRVTARLGGVESPEGTAQVTIQNSAPVAGDASLSPASGHLETTFDCQHSGFEDADQDPLTLDVIWIVEGYENPATDATTTTPLELARDGAGAPPAAGDTLRCRVVAGDGELVATAESGDVVLQALPPVAEELLSDVGFVGVLSDEPTGGSFELTAAGTLSVGPFEEIPVTGTVTKAGPDAPITWCVSNPVAVVLELPLLRLSAVTLTACQGDDGQLSVVLEGVVELEGLLRSFDGTLSGDTQWNLALDVAALPLFGLPELTPHIEYAADATTLELTASALLPGSDGSLAGSVTGSWTPDQDFTLAVAVDDGVTWAPLLAQPINIEAAAGTLGRAAGAITLELAAAGTVAVSLAPGLSLAQGTLMGSWAAATGTWTISLDGTATLGPLAGLSASGGFSSAGVGCLALTSKSENTLGVIAVADPSGSACVTADHVVPPVDLMLDLTVAGGLYSDVAATLHVGEAVPLVEPGSGAAAPLGAAPTAAGDLALLNGSTLEAGGTLQPPAGFDMPANLASVAGGLWVDATSHAVATDAIATGPGGASWSLATGLLTLGNNATIDIDGVITLPEGATLPDGSAAVPAGTLVVPVGAVQLADLSLYLPGTEQIRSPGGVMEAAPEGFEPPADSPPLPAGSLQLASGTVVGPDLQLLAPYGFEKQAGSWSNANGLAWNPTTGQIVAPDGQPLTFAAPPTPAWRLDVDLSALQLFDGLELSDAVLHASDTAPFAGVAGTLSLSPAGQGLELASSGSWLADGSARLAARLPDAAEAWTPLPIFAVDVDVVSGSVTRQALETEVDLWGTQTTISGSLAGLTVSAVVATAASTPSGIGTWSVSVESAVADSIKGGEVVVEGAFVASTDDSGDAAEVVFEGTITALGGQVTVSEVVPTTADGLPADFTLGGPTDFSVTTASGDEVPLDDGQLTLGYAPDPGVVTVTADGNLAALGLGFPLSTEIDEEGDFTFDGPPQSGTIAGLPAEEVDVTLTAEAGVALAATVPIPDLYSGDVAGDWASDADFELSGVDVLQHSQDVELDTTLTLHPQGADLAVDVNPALPDAVIQGALAGPVAWTEDGGYDYHLEAPASAAPGGLVLSDAALSIDSVTGITALGTADIGFSAPTVAAVFPKAVDEYAFTGPVAESLKGESVDVVGQLVLGTDGVELQDVTLAALGGTATIPQQGLTADGPVVDSFSLGGPAALMVGPKEDHPLEDGSLDLHYDAEDDSHSVVGEGTMLVGGVPTPPLASGIGEDGSYAFSGAADLPIDGAALGLGVAAVTSEQAAAWSGELDAAPFDTAEVAVEISPAGDMQATVNAQMGAAALELAAEMTYRHCQTTDAAFCDAAGTTFTGSATFSLAGESALTFAVDATGGAGGVLDSSALGAGDVELPANFELTDASWGFANDQVCFAGKLFDTPFEQTCLDAPGAWTITAPGVFFPVPGLPSGISGDVSLSWDGLAMQAFQAAQAAYEGVVYNDEAEIAIDAATGLPIVVSFQSTRPASGTWEIPGACVPGFGCLPAETCTLDGEAAISVTNNALTIQWCGTGQCFGDLSYECANLIDGYVVDVCQLYGLSLSGSDCLADVTPDS